VSQQPEEIDRPTQRERQRAETRERLFQAALTEFRRAGVAGARIERIASAVGVVRGTFYFHFPTKDHVLQELQLRSQERIMDHLQKLDPERDGVDELLQAIVDGLEDGAEVVNDGALLRDTLALYVRHPIEPGMGDDEPRPLLEMAATVLAAAQKRGEMRADLSPEGAVAVIFSGIFGLFATPSAPGRGGLLRDWVELVARGLAPS